MKKTIISVLEDLRKRTKAIKGYSIRTHERKLNNNRSEAELQILVDDVLIVDNTKLYNPSDTTFSKVTDMMFDEAENQFIKTGIMALYVNNIETKVEDE